MQVVWMVRLERSMEEDGSEKRPKRGGKRKEDSCAAPFGLLTAGEEQGQWMVLWEAEGAEPEIWFEGGDWVEMRASLRWGMARLMSAGYRLSLGFVPEVDIHERRMREQQEWIACYADLHPNSEVYDRLAQWRRGAATRLRRAPYWIASNRMLRMVSAYLPQQSEELEQIPGFGAVKVRDFGEEIVQITKQYARTTDFPLDWVAAAVSEPEFARWVYVEWEAKQANELAKISERRLLMEGLQQGMGIEQLMDLLQVDRREMIMRIEKIAKEGGAIEGLAEEELASMPPPEREAVESALIELGDEYIKPIYIKVFGEAALELSASEIQTNYERIRFLRLLHRRRERRQARQTKAG
ncbi:HRDC domain-containing protein [Paenibacillus popilliae]|uniref:DNA helicase n=1 Tax=Paenibacillus popilliae ATCC 14706 TaxID=1212764 RepID=M9LQ10_PAEPP|nr:HRDC domain-containing protein [Paenibacillus popilliae]GAC42706.1 DNA helicase [Paenibacillus popilliae ATCC 14706]